MLLVVRVFCLSSEVGCPRCVLKLLKNGGGGIDVY